MDVFLKDENYSNEVMSINDLKKRLFDVFSFSTFIKTANRTGLMTRATKREEPRTIIKVMANTA